MTQREMPVLVGVEHKYIQAGDVQIHVAVAGPETGPAVVLLHGWPENWWMWHKVIPALAESGYRVHAVDLRGAGWSEVTPGGYHKEQFATDVLAVADALKLQTFDLVGHDWGGWTAQLLALKSPQRVRSLALLNIAPVWNKRTVMVGHTHRLLYMMVVGAPLLGPLVHRTSVMWWYVRRIAGMPAESAAFFRECFAAPPRSVAGSKIYRAMISKEARMLVNGHYNDQRLETPVRLLFGLNDIVVQPPMLQGFRDHCDNFQLVEVPSCGHFIVDEQPQRVINWLTGLLSESNHQAPTKNDSQEHAS